MKQDLKNKLDEAFKDLGNDWCTARGRNTPLFAGTRLHFTGEISPDSVEGNKYYRFHTTEGHFIAFSQIARNGNGLGLKPGSRKAMIDEFADRIPEDGTYAVTVAEVKKQVTSFGDSNNKQTYYQFKVDAPAITEDAENNEEEKKED